MEEPIEPLEARGDCWVRIVDGARTLDLITANLKRVFYEYNRVIRESGYYLKPIHKVYKVVGGKRRVYEYYGRYWWKLKKVKGKLRYVYSGRWKPRRVKVEPPSNPLEDLVVIREDGDVIMRCSDYEKFSEIFKGHRITREY